MIKDIKQSGQKIEKSDNSTKLELGFKSNSTPEIFWQISIFYFMYQKHVLNKFNITFDEIVDYINLTEEEFIIKNIIE